MFFIESVAIIPANGSSAPLHPSTFIDEYGIGLKAISDQDSLEGARSWLKKVTDKPRAYFTKKDQKWFLHTDKL